MVICAAAVRRWSGCVEMLHVQGQRSPSKMVGTGAAAVRCWSDFEEISTSRGACQCRRCRFYPWVRKIPWRRAWKLIPLWNSPGQNTVVCSLSLLQGIFMKVGAACPASPPQPQSCSPSPASAGCNEGDLGSIPVLGRSPGGGMATHSCILAWRIPMDRGAW